MLTRTCVAQCLSQKHELALSMQFAGQLHGHKIKQGSGPRNDAQNMGSHPSTETGPPGLVRSTVADRALAECLSTTTLGLVLFDALLGHDGHHRDIRSILTDP